MGRFFTATARPVDFLRQYSSVFNAVEGNSTFYCLPEPSTVDRWRNEAQGDFRFCFKFPRAISHALRLRNATAETSEFLQRITPLAEHLGPLFLQLPPAFGPDDLAVLSRYLAKLPADLAYAVEVRHPAFFTASSRTETALHELLRERGIDLVILDSRALFSAPPLDADTREAQRKKPHLPVRETATGTKPLVRFIGHPDVAANRDFLTVWISQAAAWIAEGRQPYIFIHTPNNHNAPELARLFHTLLQEQLGEVGELPPWPAAADNGKAQLNLF